MPRRQAVLPQPHQHPVRPQPPGLRGWSRGRGHPGAAGRSRLLPHHGCSPWQVMPAAVRSVGQSALFCLSVLPHVRLFIHLSIHPPSIHPYGGPSSYYLSSMHVIHPSLKPSIGPSARPSAHPPNTLIPFKE